MSEAAANCFNINPLNAGSSSRGGLFKKKWFDSFLRYANAHNIGCSALMALILAGGLRPVTIMALPGKKIRKIKFMLPVTQLHQVLLVLDFQLFLQHLWI